LSLNTICRFFPNKKIIGFCVELILVLDNNLVVTSDWKDILDLLLFLGVSMLFSFDLLN